MAIPKLRNEQLSTGGHDVRARAFDIIESKSFKRGEVKLSSGELSDFYFDMKPTMLDPEGAFWFIERVFFPGGIA